MNFKEQTMIFLEAYNNEKEDMLEESVRNNSASNRLKSIINKAENKMNSVSDKEAADIRKTLPTIKKAYNDFLDLENAYKSASSMEKKELKNKYKELENKYSYKLKRVHMPKGVAAAIIGAALAAIGTVGGIKSYNRNQEVVKMEKFADDYNKANPRMPDEIRDIIKKDYEYKTKAQADRIAKMKEDNKKYEEENSNIEKTMEKAVKDLMVNNLGNSNGYISAKIPVGNKESLFKKEDLKKFANTLINTYGLKDIVKPGDNLAYTIGGYIDSYNKGNAFTNFNSMKKWLKDSILSNRDFAAGKETRDKLKAHPTGAMEYFRY